MKKVFIRSKGDQYHGWGNVIRQLNIAKYLTEKKFKVFFFVETDKNLSSFLKKYKFRIVKLSKKISVKKEKQILKKYGNSDASIIEMLNPPVHLQKLYLKNTEKLIVYDDLLSGKYISDILISCQGISVNKNKILNKKIKILKGYKYFPLTEKFSKNSLSKKKNKKNFKINIVLGGSYYKNLYIKIARAFKKFKYIKIRIIVSEKNFAQTKKDILNINDRIIITKPQEDIYKYLSEADALIVGGGYTKIEAASLKIPFMIICTHLHQINISKFLSKQIGCIMLGYFSKISSKLIENRIEKLISLDYRRKLLKKLYNFKPNGLETINNILIN